MKTSLCKDEKLIVTAPDINRMLTDLKRCERKILTPTIRFISDFFSKVTTCDPVRCRPLCVLFGATLASLASRCFWIHTICQIQVIVFGPGSRV